VSAGLRTGDPVMTGRGPMMGGWLIQRGAAPLSKRAGAPGLALVLHEDASVALCFVGEPWGDLPPVFARLGVARGPDVMAALASLHAANPWAADQVHGGAFDLGAAAAAVGEIWAARGGRS
jgi:hypothetical protein